MANEQNLKPITSSEQARAMQEKSVEARNKNKLIREALAKEIWAELDADPRKLREIARGFVDRAMKNSNDVLAMADIMDGKQKDTLAVENEHIVIRLNHDD